MKKIWKLKSSHRDRQTCSTQEEFGDYDLIMNYLRGGPGYGDPIERNPKDGCKPI